MAIPGLGTRTTTAASVEPTPGGGFVLRLPAGDSRGFRLSQLDDYTSRPRAAFPWRPPLTLELRARLSISHHAGTWGFGLWNDPFSLSFGIQGGARRLPALPNAAWFFFASRPNHLALRDDRPGSGFLAATFASPSVPSLLLAPSLAGLPLLAWKRASRGLRRLTSRWIRGDSYELEVDPTDWVRYSLSWIPSRVIFGINGNSIFETNVAPLGPLGLVIWMDNQYGAWRPDGTLAFGVLQGEGGTMEIEDLEMHAD